MANTHGIDVAVATRVRAPAFRTMAWQCVGLLTVGVVLGLGGCGPLTAPAATVRPGSAASPETFREALATIIDLDGKIQAASAGDGIAAAHDDLHAIGHLLETLPHLSSTAGVPIDRKAVERSAGILFEAFSRIDEKLHGGAGSTYDEQAPVIAREISGFRRFLVEHRH
jgi:hypothetical protein